MTGDTLAEAYHRLHRTGPEFGGDDHGDHGLTNHGPMAVEVMVRRGLHVDVERWLDAYVRRLDEVPRAGDRIDDDWPTALGNPRRAGDWTDLFLRELQDQPWRHVLARWWRRLLPGIAAGSTHGVIRVGHAVRVLCGDDTAPGARTELAHGLAFWAARYRPLAGLAAPAGRAPAGSALDRVPRLPQQEGLIAHRLACLADLPGWTTALAALRPAAHPEQVPDRLAELVHAATVSYLTHGASSPVLLVHVATAPNAVLHTLPALPRELWAPSHAAVWAASAAITACYAAPAARLRTTATATPAPAPRDPDDALGRAADHGDEHVLKFADTATDVFHHTADPSALAAAHHAADLIEPPDR